MRIAIIDSGLPYEYSYINEVNGFSVDFDEEKDLYCVIEANCIDEIGHGTAIVNLFDSSTKNNSFDMYKIFTDSFETSEDKLICALEYIRKKHHYDLIHISSGVVQPERYNDLYSVCNEIVKDGCIIVSAYDNDGAISYPAAFPFVIGVDMSDNRLKCNEFEFVENSIVNIRGSSSYHRLLWKNSKMILIQGASFSSVYVSLRVLELINQGHTNYHMILELMRDEAKRIYNAPLPAQYDAGFISEIKSAIVFPFNKENHSLVRFRDCLHFQIKGIYDCKYSFNVGRRINELQPDICCEELVKDIETLNWKDDFDTVILGHVGVLSEISGINYRNKIASMCYMHNKRIVSYDDFSCDESVTRYTPHISENMVPSNRFGKLRQISLPVLGIWGTSSQQGKFTLQLKIRSELRQYGYKVGWLSTEPQGSIFLADRIYPIGYNSKISISDMKAVLLLNEFMWDIACDDYDIIIVGSQSGTVPYSALNLSSYPVYQNDILFATQPDYILLCINPHDEYDYIHRTINYLEGAIDTKVIGLVLFPCISYSTDFMHRLSKKTLSDEIIKKKVGELECEFGLKVYEANSHNISKNIINAFSG